MGIQVVARPHILGFCFVCNRSRAQGSNAFDTGTINGIVLDPLGAVVPNAAVTIVNTNTGIEKTVHTDGSGSFVAPALQFGVYKVTASASYMMGWM